MYSHLLSLSSLIGNGIKRNAFICKEDKKFYYFLSLYKLSKLHCSCQSQSHLITSHTNLCVFVTFQKSRLSRREEKDDKTDYKRLTRTCPEFMMLTAHPLTQRVGVTGKCQEGGFLWTCDYWRQQENMELISNQCRVKQSWQQQWVNKVYLFYALHLFRICIKEGLIYNQCAIMHEFIVRLYHDPHQQAGSE